MSALVFGGVFSFLAMIAFLIVFIIYYVKWDNLNTCKDDPNNCSKQNFQCTSGTNCNTVTGKCTNGFSYNGIPNEPQCTCPSKDIINGQCGWS